MVTHADGGTETAAGWGRRAMRHGLALARRFGTAVPGRHSVAGALDHYVTKLPSRQNAIDAVPGWIGAMPPQTGLMAGDATLYADSRIAWLLSHCYDVTGRSVLELGPLEGSHTFMLHEAGAASIEAIEANTLAFMRCLVTKEILGLSRASFLLGDFASWLEAPGPAYDLVVASGVLYHSPDPIRLLTLIGQRTSAVFLWTHYCDDTAMPSGDERRHPFSGSVELRTYAGLTLRLHERSYRNAWRDTKYCGGTQDRHFWMERDDILALLAALGFTRIDIAHEEPDHWGGPALSIFASRPAP